jgi:hypothetical protein
MRKPRTRDMKLSARAAQASDLLILGEKEPTYPTRPQAT